MINSSIQSEILQVFDLLESTNSPKMKCEILQRHDSPLLRKVLVYALDPYRTYGIKQIPSYTSLSGPKLPQTALQGFFNVLDDCASRKLTGSAAKNALSDVLGYMAYHSMGTLAERILMRDLRCGLQPKTVNSAFKGLIKEYSVMKAKDYDPQKHKPPFIGEIKMDGKRDSAFLDPTEGLTALLSRNGLPERKYEHIKKQLGVMAKLFNEPMFIDGELMWSMFGDRSEAEKDAVFVVFDILTLAEWEGRVRCPVQVDRTSRLKSIFDRVVAPNKKTLSHIVPTTIRVLETEEEIQAFYQEVISEGGEGLMLKVPNGVYEKKRSKYWLKLKPECDADIEIVGVEEGTGKYRGMLGAIICNFKGKRVNVGSGFTDAQRKSLWEGPYDTKDDEGQWLIGWTAEVRYTEITPDGALRFPRFVKLREDK